MAVASESYAPSVLVSTERLPEKDWLEYRRRGIGGSDAAAILGISPFATARDLYYDKLKIVPFDDSESNWVAKKMGHLLEDLVAEIFHVKTGYRIYQIKKMFYHPVHTFMLADIDYFVELPGGRTAILEIKTTNYNAKDHWWSEDGQEIVPLNYEAQGRHYMSVMNIDEVFYCCLYGNNEDEVIIRHKRVAQRECVILFVRKVAEPDKSLCTVEVRDGQVVQTRGFDNEDPPAKIKAFIERWKRQVLCAADKTAA